MMSTKPNSMHSTRGQKPIRARLSHALAAALLFLADCTGPGVQGSLVPAQPITSIARYKTACDSNGDPTKYRCYVLLGTDSANVQFVRPNFVCNGTQPGCYGPAGLQQAYGIANDAKRRGRASTVAIVDAFGYPSLRSDLAEYRKAFGLPACGDGCLEVVDQDGRSSPLPTPNPNAKDDWRPEQALDLDMVSAICPNCKILLVQTRDDRISNLDQGVTTAARLHPTTISTSWGCPENTCPAHAQNSHFEVSGIPIFASAGDAGAGGGSGRPGAIQPCSLASVFCVGGTTLRPNSSARGFSEVVWDGLKRHICDGSTPCATGSGCSVAVPKPAWQTDKGCIMRSAADLSADADPDTGVIISCYVCGGYPFLANVGGTSASAPMVAAMVAMSADPKSYTPGDLWGKSGRGFNDIVEGSNELKYITFICPSTYRYICVAGPGYDGPTGWGSPASLQAF